MVHMLRIYAFGALEVELDGEALTLPPGWRVRSLLAYLALHPGRHPRGRLAGLLWPEVADANARASLRSAAWALRAALGPAADVLHGDRDSLELGPEQLWVDALEFDRLCKAGRADDAVAICRAELLANHDEEWVLASRDEYGRRLATALAALASSAESADPVDAVEWARRRADLCPLDEDAGYELIRLLGVVGDTPAALVAFAKLRASLQAELDIEPSAATVALVDQLRPTPPPAAIVQIDTAPTFFGRADELHRLRDCWRQARTGTGGVTLISGDGGIGKSRLAEEILDTARLDGARTAVCAPGALSGAPYELWSEALSELVDRGDRPPARAPWVADLARFLPGVAAYLAPDLPPASETAPAHDRVRLFEAVVELISLLAARGPLALLLEDVHTADVSSLELLRYAGRRLARLPVMVILTRRPAPPRPQLDAVLGALRAKGALRLEVTLQPLSPSVIRQLVQQVSQLPEPLESRIVAVVDGNPLLAAQTARHVAQGCGDPADGLRVATRTALARLSDASRLFVELVATSGRDVSRVEVMSLPLLTDPAIAATESLGAGLLRVREAAIGFRHESLRQAVYDDIPELRRARLHDALAGAMRRRGGTDDRRHAAELARHLQLAGHHQSAAAQFHRAAAAARAVAAMPEAAEFLQQASELTPDDADVLIELAEVQAWRGLLPESDDAFRRALSAIAPTDVGGQLTAWLRRGRWLRGGICHPREARRSYLAALDVLDRDPDTDPRLRAEALAGTAWAESVAGDPITANNLLVQVDALTHNLPVDNLLTHDVGVARAHALLRAGKFTESYGPLIAAAAAAGRAGRPDMAYSCLINAASAAACAGALDRALDFVDRCYPQVVPNGLARLVVNTYTGRAAILRRMGRTTEAAEALRLAADTADRLGSTALDGLVHFERGLLSLTTGEFADAAAELGSALDQPDAPISRPLARLHRAEALARSGRCVEAQAEIRSVAMEPMTGSDFPDTLVARMNRIEALIAADAGDLELETSRLQQAADGWQRRIAQPASGDRYVANLIDLGAPPLSSLVEPDREYRTVMAELAAITERLRSNDAHLR
ncbi:ATP-binding protein [Antrihabitans stalactiti]|uniref:Transcriptional activator domain-containing protein n=1 Tax=Antrihabitans stalactiti TaxID=2584121 RepID=A0A848K9L5_9NOCA|nr:AAA family ATPase [Antrihabitans stalactiti]NMN95039.1 transcriptional activator domain-containing protein [Antrihabitans stalactiti]